jgi:hypothetical protein
MGLTDKRRLTVKNVFDDSQVNSVRGIIIFKKYDNY